MLFTNFKENTHETFSYKIGNLQTQLQLQTEFKMHLETKLNIQEKSNQSNIKKECNTLERIKLMKE